MIRVVSGKLDQLSNEVGSPMHFPFGSILMRQSSIGFWMVSRGHWVRESYLTHIYGIIVY